MRVPVFILVIVFCLPAAGQKWEKSHEDFQKYFDAGDFVKAGEAAAKEVNLAVENLDSTDLRYMLSYYHLAQAYYQLGDYPDAKSCLARSYNLMVPYYSMHGTELADICELLGKTEMNLGYHESAGSFLSYARDVREALYSRQSYQYIHSLYDLAELEMAEADWEGMTATLVEALELHDRFFPKNQEFARYANFLGLIYLNNGGNVEAAATFRWALQAYEEPDTEKDLTFAHVSNNLALSCYYLSDFASASHYFEQADSVYRIFLDGYSENYMMLLNNLASLYYSWGKPEKARLAYGKMEEYMDKHGGEKDLNYILAVENAANYHAEMEDWKDAEKLYREAIRLREESAPEDVRQLAGAWLLLARLYADGERPDLASPPGEEALKLLVAECEPGDPDLLTCTTSLGYYYQLDKKTNTALHYYRMALDQIGVADNPDTTQVAMVHNNMGSIFIDDGRLAEAIPHLEKALELEPGDPFVLFNMGHAYQGMGNPEAARESFDMARDAYREMFGKDHPDYAQALIQGVVARFSYGDYGPDVLQEIQDAERIYLSCGEDTTSKRFIECMDSYRVYYFEQKDYRRALDYGRRSIALSREKYGKKSSIYAQDVLGQAGILVRLGEREQLEDLYREVEKITQNLEGKEREELQYSLQFSRASNYYYLEDYQRARKSMEYVVERDKEKYLDNQAFMTADERAQYNRNLTSLVDYNDYLFYFPGDEEVIANAFNNRLFLKSILMDAEMLQRRAIDESGDSLLLAMEREHAGLKIHLSNASSQFGADQNELDSLETRIGELERMMSRRIAAETGKLNRSFDWKEIRDALGGDEAAVEVIQFYHTTPPPAITFEPWYYAFIITRETEESPLCIRLSDAVSTIPAYESYRKSVESDPPVALDENIYQKLWSSIDSVVEGKSRVYFSGDGLYHELNVEALQDRQGRYMIDKYTLRNVYTLADLLKEKPVYGDNRTALLAGDPTFRMSLSGQGTGNASARGTVEPDDTQTRMFPGTRLSPLPGTRTEVDSLSSMLRQNQWEVTELTGPRATEDAIVSVSNPRILHLATHGFFAREETEGPDSLRAGESRSFRFGDVEAMSRSCLFFSGAQNTLFFAYDYARGTADGILTAYEISEMELDSTELVVLSACETGLGDVLKSEGVTGLRRAFHLAGARRIMLSLWDVDDQATQLIMRQFYANWLSGMDMDQSLTAAKRYLRDQTQYHHPRYWAAFILTGI